MFTRFASSSSPTVRPLAALLMRRARWVAAAVIAVALTLGLVRVNQDIDAEVDAAMALADAVATLAHVGSAADDDALRALSAAQSQQPLRHLSLSIRDGDGRHLLDAPPETQAPWWLRPLLALHRDWLSPADARQVQWRVSRPGEGPWTVTLAASHDSERREALTSLTGMLALLAACIGALLLVMRLNLARALAPLSTLLAAIAGIERQDRSAVRALPKMPVAELDVLAAALRHLADALAASEADRQRLARHVLTLQEDERGRLARELHDELGQCLTALRVDAAWLARRSSDRPEQLAVIEGIAARCAQMQLDVRGLLARLQPFGGQAPAETETLGRLEDLLRGLAHAWQRAGATTLAVDLDCRVCDSCGRAIDSPADLCLARPLALALFRLTQEALTNVARHARATRARVQLGIDVARRRVEWEVIDDGIGLDVAAATPRGNGIAGMRERVWALGGALSLEPASPQSARPGLRVQARFALEAVEASA